MIFQINEHFTVSPLSSAAFHLLSFYFSPPSVSLTPGLWLRPPEVDLTTRHIDTNIKPGKINRLILGPPVSVLAPNGPCNCPHTVITFTPRHKSTYCVSVHFESELE